MSRKLKPAPAGPPPVGGPPTAAPITLDPAVVADLERRAREAGEAAAEARAMTFVLLQLVTELAMSSGKDPDGAATLERAIDMAAEYRKLAVPAERADRARPGRAGPLGEALAQTADRLERWAPIIARLADETRWRDVT